MLESDITYGICLTRSLIGCPKKLKKVIQSYGLKKIYSVKFLKKKPSNRTIHLLNGYCMTGLIDLSLYEKVHNYKVKTSKRYSNRASQKITHFRLKPPKHGMKKHRKDKCLKRLLISTIDEIKDK